MPRARFVTREALRIWVKRVGRLSRWALLLTLVLWFVTTSQPFGFRRIGCQVGFRDGTLYYEWQRVVFRKPPPRGGWKFYTSDYYAGYGLSKPLFRRTPRTVEIRAPLWLPMLILAPLATLGYRPRPAPPPSPGPYRFTFWRYVAGAGEYVVFALGTTLGFGALGRPILSHECEEFPWVYGFLALVAFPYGAYLAARRQVEWANRRFPTGLCWTCRYDLNGNVSGVCPECGTAINAEQSKNRDVKTELPSDTFRPEGG